MSDNMLLIFFIVSLFRLSSYFVEFVFFWLFFRILIRQFIFLVAAAAIEPECGEDGDAGIRIYSGIHFFSGLEIAADAVFHGEKDREPITGGQEIDGALEGMIDAGGVGHEADALPEEDAVGEGEVVDAAEYMGFFHGWTSYRELIHVTVHSWGYGYPPYPLTPVPPVRGGPGEEGCGGFAPTHPYDADKLLD